MPRFCSDSCRKAPASAADQLRGAVYQRDSAIRTIAYLEENLARYRRLELAKREDRLETTAMVDVDSSIRPAAVPGHAEAMAGR